jgi:hypothetical protein
MNRLTRDSFQEQPNAVTVTTARCTTDRQCDAGDTMRCRGAVIRFLREEGLPVREDVLPEISRTIETVWHAQSAQAPRADETAVAQNR